MVPLVVAVAMTAAVSAFESHLVNVEAQVSNALTVSVTGVNDATIGTIGTEAKPKTPLSWQGNFVPIDVKLSSSFVAQGRAFTVHYQVCAQPKEATFGDGVVNADPFDPSPPPDENLDGWKFLWMGGSSFIQFFDESPNTYHWIGPSASINGDLIAGIVPPPPEDPVCPSGAIGSLDTNNTLDKINLWWEPPAFEEFYDTENETVKPRSAFGAVCGASPNVRLSTQPCVILTDPPANSQGTPLGLDLVIQVTNIQ